MGVLKDKIACHCPKRKKNSQTLLANSTCPPDYNEGKSSPVTGLEWPRGFQEVKVPRLHDNGTGW